MKQITISSLAFMHPKEVNKILEDRKAEIIWARSGNNQTILPKSQIIEYKTQIGRDYLKNKESHPTLSLYGIKALFN